MKLLSKAIHGIIDTCATHSELIEKSKFFDVDSKTLLRMKLHSLICRKCKSYSQHSELIDSWIAASSIEYHSAIDTSIIKERILQNTTKKTS
jgi:hypothetical protein